MAKNVKIAAVIFGAVVLLLAGFVVWFIAVHSMQVARSFDVGSPSAAQRILIATQGSEYKDALVATVVDQLRARMPYIKVIDVAQLSVIKEKDWNAIVIIHTWQVEKPEQHAKAFVDTALDRKKLIVMATSASGKEKLTGVDAISSASRMEDVATRAQEIVARLDLVLAQPQ